MHDRNHVHIALVLILVAGASGLGLFMGRVTSPFGGHARCRGAAERTWVLECLRMNTAVSVDVVQACDAAAEDLFARACPEPAPRIVELDAQGRLLERERELDTDAQLELQSVDEDL